MVLTVTDEFQSQDLLHTPYDLGKQTDKNVQSKDERLCRAAPIQMQLHHAGCIWPFRMFSYSGSCSIMGKPHKLWLCTFSHSHRWIYPRYKSESPGHGPQFSVDTWRTEDWHLIILLLKPSALSFEPDHSSNQKFHTGRKLVLIQVSFALPPTPFPSPFPTDWCMWKHQPYEKTSRSQLNLFPSHGLSWTVWTEHEQNQS